MGIINHDPYEWEYLDEPIVDTYITLQNNSIGIRKNLGVETWEISAAFTIYRNLASFVAQKRALDVAGVRFTVTTDELNNKKIRDHVYDAIKINYPNHEELPDD